MHGSKKITRIKTLIYICIMLRMALYYLMLNTDNCTQGNTTWYFVSAGVLFFLNSIFLFLLIIDFKQKRCIGFTVLFSQIALLGYALYESIPYFIFTTIKGYSLYYGCDNLEGFTHQQHLGRLTVVAENNERILPVIYIGLPLFTLIILAANLLMIKHANADRIENKFKTNDRVRFSIFFAFCFVLILSLVSIAIPTFIGSSLFVLSDTMKYFFIEQLHFENIVFLEFILLVLRVLVRFILGFIVAYYVFPSRYLSNINKKGHQVKDKEGNVIPPASQNDWERQGKTINSPKIKMHDPSKLGEPGYIPPDGPNQWLIAITGGYLLADITNTIINSKIKILYRLDNNLNKDGTQYENNTKKENKKKDKFSIYSSIFMISMCIFFIIIEFIMGFPIYNIFKEFAILLLWVGCLIFYATDKIKIGLFIIIISNIVLYILAFFKLASLSVPLIVTLLTISTVKRYVRNRKLESDKANIKKRKTK